VKSRDIGGGKTCHSAADRDQREQEWNEGTRKLALKEKVKEKTSDETIG